jgi:hypothetical protein
MLDKTTATALIQEHGIEALPARVVQTSVDEATLLHEIVDLCHEEPVVVRAAADHEARNLPRVIGVPADVAVKWIRDLAPGLSVVVQPYAELLYSIELLVTQTIALCEIVPGIWELDNQAMPTVLQIALPVEFPEDVRLVQLPLKEQTARFQSIGRGTSMLRCFVGDTAIAETAAWIADHASGLLALRSHMGRDFILKGHYSVGFGLSPQNLRTAPPVEAELAYGAAVPPRDLPVVSSGGDDLSDVGEAVLLRVSVAREMASELEHLASRLVEHGVRTVYLESGILSHLAIVLRETGLCVQPFGH